MPSSALNFPADTLAPSRRERRKEARPRELLDAALELFVEKGFAATRAEEVAKLAGVSKGTLFLYYSNKEALFKAVVRETISGRFAEWSTELTQFQGSSSDLLRYCVHSWWTHIGNTRAAGISKLMMSEARNFPELAAFYQREVIQPGNALIERVLQRGVATGAPRPRLHVNIAGSDLARPGFVSQVATVLLVNGLDPAQLTLEIAETLLMQRLDGARETLGRLRELGVGLAVGHFGAGDSSLAHLSTLPLTSLKIDRSFVQQLGTRPQDTEVVRAFITLGQALGRTVIAEGIETPAQLARLRELGCVLGQGYLLARPRRAPQDWLYLPWQAGEFAATASPEAALA